MTGLALQFDGLTGWTLFPDKLVQGFDATVQCALVNMALEQGESRMFPAAGTTLLSQGVGGLLNDINDTRHAANFAAAETKEFVNSHTPEGALIRSLLLQPALFEPPNLELNAMFVSSDQEERGILLSA